MSIEHFVPASADAARVNDYANCFYACRFCNRARSIEPLWNEQGHRLIEPCSRAWGEHFSAEGDRLVPGDPDAAYTEKVYDLNDPRKVMMRQSRRERMEEWLALVKKGPPLVEALLQGVTAREDAQEAEERLRAAHELQRCVGRALEDLRRFAAVPRDADAACRCVSPRALPSWLAEQTLEFGGDE